MRSSLFLASAFALVAAVSFGCSGNDEGGSDPSYGEYGSSGASSPYPSSSSGSSSSPDPSSSGSGSSCSTGGGRGSCNSYSDGGITSNGDDASAASSDDASGWSDDGGSGSSGDNGGNATAGVCSPDAVCGGLRGCFDTCYGARCCELSCVCSGTPSDPSATLQCTMTCT